MAKQSRIKKRLKKHYNFAEWIGKDNIKKNSKSLYQGYKKIFNQDNISRIDFKKSNERDIDDLLIYHNISKVELFERYKLFRKLFVMFFIFALALLVYTIKLLLEYDILSFCVGLSVVLICLANSFRYHFWAYQIKIGKVGCSIYSWAKHTFSFIR